MMVIGLGVEENIRLSILKKKKGKEEKEWIGIRYYGRLLYILVNKFSKIATLDNLHCNLYCYRFLYVDTNVNYFYIPV